MTSQALLQDKYRFLPTPFHSAVLLRSLCLSLARLSLEACYSKTLPPPNPVGQGSSAVLPQSLRLSPASPPLVYLCQVPPDQPLWAHPNLLSWARRTLQLLEEDYLEVAAAPFLDHKHQTHPKPISLMLSAAEAAAFSGASDPYQGAHVSLHPPTKLGILAFACQRTLGRKLTRYSRASPQHRHAATGPSKSSDLPISTPVVVSTHDQATHDGIVSPSMH